MKRTLLILALLCGFGATGFSQNDEISLVVSGDGTTKEEATKNALRSAIEQAYGTFVSANTTILNDDIVKDEIVTISSGNIKSYKVLSSTPLPNESYSVTITATVSIGKLISYIQSKGASTEFAGQTFMMNMKMRDLNKTNEKYALQHLVTKLKMISSSFYDYSMDVSDPQETQYYEENNTRWIDKYRYEPTAAIDGYKLPISIYIRLNTNFRTWVDEFSSTLSAIALSKNEQEEYRKNNTKVFGLCVFSKQPNFAFRNDTKEFERQINQALQDGLLFDIIEKHTNNRSVSYHYSVSGLTPYIYNNHYDIPSSYGHLRVECQDKPINYNPWWNDFNGFGILENTSRSIYHIKTNEDGEYDRYWKLDIPLLFDKESLYTLAGIEVQPRDLSLERIQQGLSILKEYLISEKELESSTIETSYFANLDSGNWSDWESLHSSIHFDINTSTIVCDFIENGGKYSILEYGDWEEDNNGWKRVIIDCQNAKGNDITIKLRKRGNDRQFYILPTSDRLRSFCLQIQKPVAGVQTNSGSSSLTASSLPAIPILPPTHTFSEGEIQEIKEGAQSFALVEQKPSFDGGDLNVMLKWVQNQIPIEIQEAYRGRQTFSIWISNEGFIADAELSRGTITDEEVISKICGLFKAYKQVIPGKQRGENVAVCYVMPLIFNP